MTRTTIRIKSEDFELITATLGELKRAASHLLNCTAAERAEAEARLSVTVSTSKSVLETCREYLNKVFRDPLTEHMKLALSIADRNGVVRGGNNPGFSKRINSKSLQALERMDLVHLFYGDDGRLVARRGKGVSVKYAEYRAKVIDSIVAETGAIPVNTRSEKVPSTKAYYVKCPHCSGTFSVSRYSGGSGLRRHLRFKHNLVDRARAATL